MEILVSQSPLTLQYMRFPNACAMQSLTYVLNVQVTELMHQIYLSIEREWNQESSPEAIQPYQVVNCTDDFYFILFFTKRALDQSENQLRT